MTITRVSIMNDDKKKFFVSRKTLVIICILVVVGIYTSLIVRALLTGHM